MDDDELIARARSGDRDAFAEIVARYQDALYAIALRMLGHPEDACDVVQETFMRAYLNLPRLRRGATRGWLFRVATNVARDLRRRSARRPVSPLEDATGKVIELPDPGIGPAATAEERERTAAVRAAILRLPVDHREVVVLRDVGDLSYEEIAAALSLPMGTVKSRLSRARTQLAGLLRGSPALAGDVGTGG